MQPTVKSPRFYKSKPPGKPPPPSSPYVTKAMKSNKGSGTKPELVLAKQLRRKLVVSALPGRPDFVYEKAKLAVFVHGCWWHGCPEHYTPPKTHGAFWRRKLQRNIERDKLNRRELEALGWKVVEVWEHEVRNNPSRAARRILKLVQRK